MKPCKSGNMMHSSVQAVVRAMDTVTDFMSKISAKTNITKFVVAGLSKVSLYHVAVMHI